MLLRHDQCKHTPCSTLRTMGCCGRVSRAGEVPCEAAEGGVSQAVHLHLQPEHGPVDHTGHCKAITGPKTSPPSVKKYHGLKRCQARRPGKKTAGCGYTCNRRSGRWVEKKCSSNSAWAWPTYFGFEEDLFCLNGKVIDAKLR